VATILLYGDTTRHPAMRHEVPLVVIDPFLFVDGDGEPLVVTSALEQARIAEARPDAHVALFDDFGLYDLVDAGTARHEAELEVLFRALREWDVEAALVSPDLPADVAAIAAVVRGALEAARGAARPAITGEALYEVAAAVVEDAGFPTQRTREPGRRVTTGFWFALGHGRRPGRPRAAAARARRHRAARPRRRPGDRAGHRGSRGHRRRPLRGSAAHHRGRLRDADQLSVRPLSLSRRHAGAASSS
jgi:hypothetical protein